MHDRLDIEIGHATHVGLVREHNEDAVLVRQLVRRDRIPAVQCTLCALADGMGGHLAGEVASSMALEVLSTYLNEAFSVVAVLDAEACAAALVDGAQHANSAIYLENVSTHRDMGTTLVAALLIGNSAYIANVGDSRAYLLHGDDLRHVTTDHSLVAELVAAGRLAPEDVYTHPRRNIVTRSLGIESTIRVDSFFVEMNQGSVLLLCSDGLWEMVHDEQLRSTLLQPSSAQESCDVLVALANHNGGSDNIAVIVVKVK